MNISEEIRDFRKKNNLTKNAFARYMEMNLINVYRWENYGQAVHPLWLKELKRKGVIKEGFRKGKKVSG